MNGNLTHSTFASFDLSLHLKSSMFSTILFLIFLSEGCTVEWWKRDDTAKHASVPYIRVSSIIAAIEWTTSGIARARCVCGSGMADMLVLLQVRLVFDGVHRNGSTCCSRGLPQRLTWFRSC